ncbi:hypothetical protein EMCG_04004 [[Emmonsia] crescens]|uniref:Aminoglycoside phosphotransferase domain-containing protein n=1 Tax=[Emmonsia] crescens TaxID=73230 RepID=A0A0G2IZD7_9EURO|nr:hypothetical protein EMCG_04004 [Emmonsia crescens UAMH 3008]
MASDMLKLAELQRQLAEAEQARLEAEQDRDKANERADRLEETQAPTALEEYLQLVQQRLVSVLSIEPNPTKAATGSVTSVDRKYYPLELYSWDDFPEKHNETFSQFMNLFSEKPLFPSKTDVLAIRQELSPTSRKDEQDIRPFIRTAIEKPAQRVVMAYLGHIGNSDRFFFQNNAYSLENRTLEDETGECEIPPPCKKRSLERKISQPIPDRWGICEPVSGSVRRVCVGEYKAAHKIPTEGIIQVLTSPSVELFLEVLRRKQSGIVNSGIEKTREQVAHILCQTFHYMITSGLLYGYVALGEILIFLMIKKSAPQKLYFYLTRVATKPPCKFVVRHAPAAQLATFATLSLCSTEMRRDWITKAKNCGIYQWPLLPPSHLTHDITLRPRRLDDEESESSEEEHEGPGDDDYNSPSEGRSRIRSQPNQQTGQRRRSPRKRTRTQRPILPYCTQACLLGLVQDLPLDPSCPNTALHQQGQTCKKHLVTKEDLCALTKKQLARSLDKDCECLDREGLFGNIGVLFKITLTEYGYTFVAKGVQGVDEPHLAHEARIYAHLSHLQGTKVPIFLGNITLELPYPLVSLARVTQMMLMSWAGTSIGVKSWLEGVDIEMEKEETLHALASSGVSHNDVGRRNLIWNPEQKQVMAIDFDQATIHHTQKRRASTSPLASPKRKMIKNENKQKTLAASHPGKLGKENMNPTSFKD